MEDLVNIILLTSFVGIVYYSVWVIILVLSSIRGTKGAKTDVALSKDLELYILMPMLDEAPTVQRTLSNFIQNTQNLPQVKLGVIDDGSVDGTAQLIKDFITKNNCEDKIKLFQRVLPDAQTGKGDALNYGLNYIRNGITSSTKNVVIGVLDADAIMHEEDLKKVLIEFDEDPDLALLQVKVKMHNVTNWLQRMQDIEFTTINDWIQGVRNRLDNAAASGNGQFIRLSSVENEVAPWGNALLEDFEFSTKFLLQDKKTKYGGDIVVYQEAVDKIKPFIRQRSRWCQGGIDCTGKYLRNIVKSKTLKFWAKFEMMFFMFLPFLTVVVGTANMIALVYAVIHIKKFWGLLLFLIAINLFLAYYMGVKYTVDSKRVNLKLLLLCSGMVIYNLILFPAIIIAFYRKLTGNNQWIKTSHGVTSDSTE